MPDVIVVGAGVMGAALARYRSRAGASVAVVDQNEVGGGTSSATFSVDITTRKTPREYFDLSLASVHEHARLAAESGAGATWYHLATVYERRTRYSTATSDRPRPEPVRTEGSAYA